MSDSIEVNVNIRESAGTSTSRLLRRNGMLPAIVYGAGLEEKKITVVNSDSFYHLSLAEDAHTRLINLVGEDIKESVLLREVQYHPVKNSVLHADFQRVVLDEEMDVVVPLHILNIDECHAVKMEGAQINIIINEVSVRTLPDRIPAFIELNVQDLRSGDVLHLSDLKIPDSVQLVSLLSDDDAVVLSVLSTSTVLEDDVANSVESEEKTDE